MRIGIGIDTGGTYTDAVAYDYDAGALLAKGKSLTTREDLSIGIGKALDILPQEYIRDALLVSLSTTLATNACLEDKGGRAKLLVFGLTDELLERFDAAANYGLKKSAVRCIDTHGSADGLIASEPDWHEVLAVHGDWLRDADALSASELYSMNNGAPCEKHLKKLSEEQFGLPCVCASEFTSEINVLVRGATALLNARMLPIVREFVEAAIEGFRARGCKAPIMVVRSDGGMMSSELSLARPVETILSGPAASVLAGKSLCEETDYIILDMGGTSTDISIVRDGRPVAADDGIELGGWKTAVKGVHTSPFALGGDSTIRLYEGKLQLLARRATPLCIAAQRWPEIKGMLSELLRGRHANKFPLHEIFYLVREPAEQKSYDKDELALIKLLRGGPCILDKLQERAGIDLYHFSGERLEEEGVIMRCGLTPTDFMHIAGDYTEYDAEASILAARYFLLSKMQEETPEAISALADEAYRLVESRMFENLLRVMLTRQYPDALKNGVGAQIEFLIRKAWEERSEGARGHGSNGSALIRHVFSTDAALVGIGAPTHVFLPAVAEALGAKCILPEHAEVANAIGALMADINVAVRVEISKRLSSDGRTFYIAHTPYGSERFSNLRDAIDLARSASIEAALSEARARGAVGGIPVNTRVEKHSAVSNAGSAVSLGSSVVSEAVVRLGPENRAGGEYRGDGFLITQDADTYHAVSQTESVEDPCLDETRVIYKNELIGGALAGGFTRAVQLDGLNLECEASLRAYCNPRGCPNHGNNWVCPPGCGTIEECAFKVGAFDCGVLLQSVTMLDTAMKNYKELNLNHNMRLRGFIEKHCEGKRILALTSGGCIFCDVCAFPEPCVKPDVRMNSLSAYGIDVGKLCEKAGWDYSFRPDRVYFTALVLVGS